MAKYTVRDRLWIFAMKRTHRNGEAITASQLANMADASERSARDVLKTMADAGVLRDEKVGRKTRYIPEWGEAKTS